MTHPQDSKCYFSPSLPCIGVNVVWWWSRFIGGTRSQLILCGSSRCFVSDSLESREKKKRTTFTDGSTLMPGSVKWVMDCGSRFMSWLCWNSGAKHTATTFQTSCVNTGSLLKEHTPRSWIICFSWYSEYQTASCRKKIFFNCALAYNLDKNWNIVHLGAST